MSSNSQVSYVGSSATIPGKNTFDWLFSNPFQHENGWTPAKQRVPKIKNEHAVFVDHASGKLNLADFYIRDSNTLQTALLHTPN